MRCERAREMLSDYSLGLLAPRDRDDLQAHLSGCEECSRRLGQLRSLDALLGAQRLEAPEALVQRVMTQARAEGFTTAPRWLQLVDGTAPLLSYSAVAGVACLVAWRMVEHWLRMPVPLPMLSGLSPIEVTALLVLGLGGVAAAASWLALRGAEEAV